MGWKPMDPIELEIVKLDKTYLKENVLHEDDLYRYLYQTSKQHGNQKRQA